MNATPAPRHVDLDALQARFALRVAASLSEHSAALPHDLSERLRVARQQAVALARHQRRTETVPAAVQVSAGGSVALGQPPSWWVRVASVLPLMVLVVGLLAIQHLHTQAEIQAAADVDAALLADDLPPEAYGDPGFAEFLRQPKP